MNLIKKNNKSKMILANKKEIFNFFDYWDDYVYYYDK